MTGGINNGVTRHVGDALISERSPRLRNGRVVSIGIAPWGVVENRQLLIGQKRDVTYLSIDQPRSRFAVLNNRHSYFLLVDNGTAGRYGAEIALRYLITLRSVCRQLFKILFRFRRKLEKFISTQSLPSRIPCTIPTICLVIEGGMHTIRTVLQYVTDSPPVPVVVCEGSGRAADLIAFFYKRVADSGDKFLQPTETTKGQLLAAVQTTFNTDASLTDKLYNELLVCVSKRHLITIFQTTESSPDTSHSGTYIVRLQSRASNYISFFLMDDALLDEDLQLDQVMLSALFRSNLLSEPEQLSLALTWNRVDIARSAIFAYGQEWRGQALEEAMMEALDKNRVDFVRLLLERGVHLRRFLTISRLEELYNSKRGPTNTLRYIVRDVHPNLPKSYAYTLMDIGLAVNKLMGGAYRCAYTQRKFRLNYQLEKNQLNELNAGSLLKGYR